MNFPLARVRWQYGLFYSDDIFIFLHSPHKHVDDVQQSFDVITRRGRAIDFEEMRLFRAILIIFGMSLALDGSKYQHECLTYYSYSNIQLHRRILDVFQGWAMSFVTSFQISLA